MFTIRGKLLIFALEIIAGAIMLSSMPPLVWWLQLILAVVAVGVIALAAVLGRSIAEGVDQLVAATRRIGHGEYDEPVIVRTNDEMGTLGVEIDRMRRQLGGKVRELEEFARDLERKVEKRTEELHRANDQLSLIQRITAAVSSSLDFQKIFDSVVEGTSQLVEFDQASLMRVVDANTATVFAMAPHAAKLREEKIPLAGSRVAQVLRRRAPVVFDVPFDAGSEDTLNLSAICREVVLPLVVGDQVIGTFNLGSRRSDAFPQREVAVLSQIAAELAVALMQAEAYEREHAAAQTLKELSDLKSDFVSKVSHELRTPLTSIIGAADNMLDGIAGALEERPRTYLTRIRDNGHRLLRLINELLDLARIESGKEEIRASRFQLDLLIRETLETLKPLADERGVVLQAVDPPALAIRADRDKISRVLINLVHNGIKFSPAGGSVAISARGEDTRVVVAVRDSGAGIPPSELARIFDKFHQVKRSGAGAAAGSGLGLTISRQLVEMHGGQLTVESVRGGGSTFEVVLPQTPPATAAETTSPESWRES